MNKLPYKDNISSVKKISPDTQKGCFFSYYDLKAYDDSDRYHLCSILPFEGRIQTAGDSLELGVVEINSGKYEKIDDTKAWSFQQGAMLQWSRSEKDTVYYNVFEKGEYLTVKKNLATGSMSYSPVCASIAPDGTHGVGVSFDRIFDFRPGYGYCCTKDPYANIAQPENDGVFLVDLEKGTQKLILTYPDMVRKAGIADVADDKFVVNHITLSPDGDKFIILLRNFPVEGKSWGTVLMVSDLEGNIKPLTDLTVYSHYHWKNNSELLGYCKINGELGMWTVNVDTGEWTKLPLEGWPGRDIHCLYSPDQRFFIGDNYCDDEGYREIKIYDTVTNEADVLIRSYSPNLIFGDIDLRCDLHNRWNTKGNKISFDTVHSGKREIWELDFAEYYNKKYR